MARSPKKTLRQQSARLNNLTYDMYYNRLLELAINVYEWKNLPDTVDPRFLEMTLATQGMAVFFQDEVLGYLCLQTMIGGHWDVYNIPTVRTAYATNGYQNLLDVTNSVLIFDNYMHTNVLNDIEMYALRLYNIERTLDVNVNGQKTPFIIKCTEQQRLTMLNLYMQYDGNEPFIFADENMNVEGIQVFPTPAPFVGDKLNFLKRQVWNEALTFFGIENNTSDKKERLSAGEITVSLGGVEAQRFVRLNARRQAAEQINEMFGLNIEVDFREEIKTDFQNVSRETLEEGDIENVSRETLEEEE